MGIELDVLVGHPEHELIFVATQITKAAGYANAGTRASDYAKLLREEGTLITIGDIASQTLNYSVCGPKDSTGRMLQKRAPMVTESQAYALLLRGHAPASEPFRKWVTEEVLPTIRKTGSYNAAESSDPIAQGVTFVARFYVDSTSLAGV